MNEIEIPSMNMVSGKSVYAYVYMCTCVHIYVHMWVCLESFLLLVWDQLSGLGNNLTPDQKWCDYDIVGKYFALLILCFLVWNIWGWTTWSLRFFSASIFPDSLHLWIIRAKVLILVIIGSQELPKRFHPLSKHYSLIVFLSLGWYTH